MKADHPSRNNALSYNLTLVFMPEAYPSSPPQAVAPSLRRPLVLLLLLLAALPFLPVLGGYFLADDFGTVQKLHRVGPAELLRFFAADWSLDIWGFPLRQLRPIVAISYRLDALFWNLNPFGYHLTNLLVHLLNCLLVFCIARALCGDVPGVPLLAAAFFALAPVHAEAVSWISGRVDLFAALFCLSSFFFFLRFVSSGGRPHYLLSLLAFTFGLFSKESSVTLPILLALYWVLYRPRRSPAALLPFFLILALYMSLRTLLFPSALTSADMNTATLQEFLPRQLFYLAQLLFPTSPLDVPALRAAVIFLLAAGLVLGRAHLRHLTFAGPIWYFPAILPLVVTYPTERHLYFASAGVSIVLALACSGFGGALRVAPCLWLLLYGASLCASNLRWVAFGRLSWEIKKAVETHAAALPAGSVIILGPVPEGPEVNPTPNRTLVTPWDCGLPFALQQPFSGVYARHTLIEPPELVCRRDWWETRGPLLQQALASPVHVLNWHPDTRAPAFHTLSPERVKIVHEQVLNRPFGATPLSEEEAMELLGSLQQTGLPE